MWEVLSYILTASLDDAFYIQVKCLKLLKELAKLAKESSV